ncbi:hypothetical protein GCM10009605_45220 [Nocardiopsis composta]
MGGAPGDSCGGSAAVGSAPRFAVGAAPRPAVAPGVPAAGVPSSPAGGGSVAAAPTGREVDGGVQERTTVWSTTESLGSSWPTSRLSSCWAVGRLAGSLSSAGSTSSLSEGSSPSRFGAIEAIWCSTAGTEGASNGARPVPAKATRQPQEKMSEAGVMSLPSISSGAR